MMRNSEASLPQPYWGSLSQSDKIEYHRLRNFFHQSQKMSCKDRRLVSFSNELTEILKYIEHSETGRENRTVLVGVCFAGPFIGVNTRQLKNFLGRCKSSINGSLQQLGYVALKTKSKARTCILSILPSLVNDQNNLRQWTIRWASEDAQICFVTSLRSLQLPIVTQEDLNEEGRPTTTNQSTTTSSMNYLPPHANSQPINSAQGKTLHWKPPVYVQEPSSTPIHVQQTSQSIQIQSKQVLSNSVYSLQQTTQISSYVMTPSISVDCFGNLDELTEPEQPVESDWNPIWEKKTLTRSLSGFSFLDSFDGF